MIAKGYSLTNARRITAFLENEANLYIKNARPLTGLPDVSIEDLLIALSTSSGLKGSEVFEMIKIASSQQSDPPKSLVGIAKEVNDIINLRPSLWVKRGLGVLETTDVVINNDTFIMTCARGDMKKFEEYMNKGQELAALHSTLKYTALHAAVDFGSKDVVERLLLTGISPNVRDARFGRTALHFAAQSGRSEIASLLLDKGADRSIAAYDNVLPFEIADHQGHIMCREILKQVPTEIRNAHVSMHSLYIL